MNATTYQRLSTICIVLAMTAALVFDSFPQYRIAVGVTAVLIGAVAAWLYFSVHMKSVNTSVDAMGLHAEFGALRDLSHAVEATDDIKSRYYYLLKHALIYSPLDLDRAEAHKASRLYKMKFKRPSVSLTFSVEYEVRKEIDDMYLWSLMSDVENRTLRKSPAKKTKSLASNLTNWEAANTNLPDVALSSKDATIH